MARTDLTTFERELVSALRPFAAFHVRGAPDQHVITQGSPLAKRQLTMGDCRRAAELLDALDQEGRK